MAKILGLDIGTNSIGWALVDDEANRIMGGGVRLFPEGVARDDKTKAESSRGADRTLKRGLRRRMQRWHQRRNALWKRFLAWGIHPVPARNANEAYGLRTRALTEPLTLAELATVWLLLARRRGFQSNRKEEARAASKEGDEDLGKVKEGIQNLDALIAASGKQTLGAYLFSLLDADGQVTSAEGRKDDKPRIRDRWISRKQVWDEFDAIWHVQQAYHPTLLTGDSSLRTVRTRKDDPARQTLYWQVARRTIFYQRPLKSQRSLVKKCRFIPTERGSHLSHPLYQEFRVWDQIHRLKRYDADLRGLRFLTPVEKQRLADFLAEHDKVKKSDIKALLGVKAPRGQDEFNDVLDGIRGNSTFGRVAAIVSPNQVREWQETPHVDKLGQPVNKSQFDVLWDLLTFAEHDDWLTERLQRAPFDLKPDLAAKLAKVRLEDGFASISAKALRRLVVHMAKPDGLMYSEATAAEGWRHSDSQTVTERDDRELRHTVPAVAAYADELTALGQSVTVIRNPIVQRALGEVVKLVNAVINLYGKPDTVRLEVTRQLRMSKEEREKAQRTMMDRQKLRNEAAAFIQLHFKDQLNADGFRIKGRPDEVDMYLMWQELAPHGEGPEQDQLRELMSQRRFKTTDLKLKRLWEEGNRCCPYTGQVIPLSSLFTGEIQVDHIWPYSRSQDDSFANKTLCWADTNRAKGDRTALEFVAPAQHPAFRERVKHLEKLSPGKYRRFTTADIPEGFVARQLVDTAIIATQSVQLLKQSIRHVEVTTGEGSAKLRMLWGLVKLYDAEELAKGVVTQQTRSGKNRMIHLHHAVDALVVALADTRTRQRLAAFSSAKDGIGKERFFDAYGQWRYSEIRPHFPAAWPQLQNDAQTWLETVLVSYRPESRRIVKGRTNPYRHANPSGEKAVQHTLAIRGTLHEETNFGQIQDPEEEGTYTFVVRKPLAWFDNYAKMERVVDAKVRELMHQRVRAAGLAVREEAKAKGEIKRRYQDEEKTAPRNPVANALTELPLYMHAPKTGKQIAIRHVRVRERRDELKELYPSAVGGTAIGTKPKGLFVPAGRNDFFAVYEGERLATKGKAKGQMERVRECRIISFYDAVQHRLAGEPVVPTICNGLPLLFVVRPEDPVLLLEADADPDNPTWRDAVIRPGQEHPDVIQWDNPVWLAARLYRVGKFTGNSLYVARHCLSGLNLDRDAEPAKFKRAASSLHLLPVRVDILGRIQPLPPIRL